MTNTVMRLIATGAASDLGRALAGGAASVPPSRDQLAMAAMQGLCANGNPNAEWSAKQIAKYAYEQADAMLEEGSR